MYYNNKSILSITLGTHTHNMEHNFSAWLKLAWTELGVKFWRNTHEILTKNKRALGMCWNSKTTKTGQ